MYNWEATLWHQNTKKIQNTLKLVFKRQQHQQLVTGLTGKLVSLEYSKQTENKNQSTWNTRNHSCWVSIKNEVGFCTKAKEFNLKCTQQVRSWYDTIGLNIPFDTPYVILKTEGQQKLLWRPWHFFKIKNNKTQNNSMIVRGSLHK